MKNKKEEAAIIIAYEIFKREVESVEKILENKTKLKKDLLYDNEAINNSLRSSFLYFNSILRRIINEYYQGYFEMPNFLKMNCENFEETLNNNLQILAAAKRIQKFIN